MISASKEIKYFDENKEIPFIKWEALHQLYEIFSIKQTHNIEFQAFVSLLQDVGEEKGIMRVEEEEQDDYIPLAVIQDFALHFIKISFLF